MCTKPLYSSCFNETEKEENERDPVDLNSSNAQTLITHRADKTLENQFEVALLLDDLPLI